VSSLYRRDKVINSDRIKNLPPYLFAEIDNMIAQAKQDGIDVISFGIGDPDLPTPENVVNKMKQAVQDPSTHSYPSYEGLFEYRQAVSNWYEERFNVSIDPKREVVSLIGSKEGLAHLPFCYINPGDFALIPDPSYPVYNTAVLLAGGKSIKMPLVKENNFLPDLNKIDKDVVQKTKLMFINYPNNPTGAVADIEFYNKVVEFAIENDIIVVHDAAYSDIGLDDYKPLSFLEAEGAKEIGIEFNSLSKTFNMTGWRIGWAVGSEDVVESLGRIKTNIDSGIFEAVQYAGIEALSGPKDNILKACSLYSRRRDLLVEGLRSLGWKINKNKASFYLWVQVPDGSKASDFSTKVFKKTGVFFTPGIGYGKEGEDYIRIALTVKEDRIKEALKRLEDSNFIY